MGTHVIWVKQRTPKVKWLYVKQVLTMQTLQSGDLCIVDDGTGQVLFVCASLTVVSTIRTKILWNKICDKKKNIKTNKLRFFYSPLTYLGGVFCTHWGLSTFANAQKPKASLYMYTG